MLHIINKNRFKYLKVLDNNLKTIDGVSFVIKRDISFNNLKKVSNILYKLATITIKMCSFFIANLTVSTVLVSGVKGLFGIKKFNLINWLPKFIRVVAGTTAGYEIRSIKNQLGLNEILQEFLRKDSILGSAIGSTIEIISEDITKKATVAATAGLIAVSTGVVEPSLISSAMYLPYKAIKNLGSTAVTLASGTGLVKGIGMTTVTAAATGYGLGGISLGVIGFVLGSKYLAPELIEKSLSLPEKILKRSNELNTPSVKIVSEIRSELTGKYIEIPTKIIDESKSLLEVVGIEVKKNNPQLYETNVDVKKSYEILDKEFITTILSKRELENTVPVKIEEGYFGFKIKSADVVVERSDFFIKNEKYELEVPPFEQVKKILNTNENLPNALNENEVLVNVIKSTLIRKYKNTDEKIVTMGYKNPVYKTELIEEYKGVEYQREVLGPSEIENSGNNLNKLLKYSSEMCKVYIDNYTLTEHLIIIGSVSLISYGVYKLIKHYWKNPENVVSDN
jgi:hypothetical protein